MIHWCKEIMIFDLENVFARKALKKMNAICKAALVSFLLGFPFTSVAWSEFNNLGETCPDTFSVVDFGVWKTDNTGDDKFGYGGVLLNIGLQDKSKSYYENHPVRCVSRDFIGKKAQFREGLEVALVSSVTTFFPIGAITGAAISNSKTGDDAYRITELDNYRIFQYWKDSQKLSDPNGIISNDNYSCLFDSENPKLDGHGDYTCIANIEGMPNPNTFFRCGRWGGCEVEYSLPNGLRFSLNSGGLKHNSIASEPQDIPSVVKYWSKFVLDFHQLFLEAVLPRNEEIDLKR